MRLLPTVTAAATLAATMVFLLPNAESYLQAYDFDFMSQPTLEQILSSYKTEQADDDLREERTKREASPEPQQRRRQQQQQQQPRQPPLPTGQGPHGDQAFPDISFRDMAAIVTEAERAIGQRFNVLEPAIYESNARQSPKSPGKIHNIGRVGCLFVPKVNADDTRTQKSAY